MQHTPKDCAMLKFTKHAEGDKEATQTEKDGQKMETEGGQNPRVVVVAMDGSKYAIHALHCKYFLKYRI